MSKQISPFFTVFQSAANAAMTGVATSKRELAKLEENLP
jgi:hypothetical protein